MFPIVLSMQATTRPLTSTAKSAIALNDTPRSFRSLAACPALSSTSNVPPHAERLQDGQNHQQGIAREAHGLHHPARSGNRDAGRLKVDGQREEIADPGGPGILDENGQEGRRQGRSEHLKTHQIHLVVGVAEGGNAT